MDREKLLEILENVIGKSLPDIPEGLEFGKDMNFDSLDMIQLSIEIENKSGIRIDEKKFGKVRTIGDLLAVLGEGKK